MDYIRLHEYNNRTSEWIVTKIKEKLKISNFYININSIEDTVYYFKINFSKIHSKKLSQLFLFVINEMLDSGSIQYPYDVNKYKGLPSRNKFEFEGDINNPQPRGIFHCHLDNRIDKGVLIWFPIWEKDSECKMEVKFIYLKHPTDYDPIIEQIYENNLNGFNLHYQENFKDLDYLLF